MAATTSIIDTACRFDYITIPCAASSANSVLGSATAGCASKLCGVFFSSLTAATAHASVYSKFARLNFLHLNFEISEKRKGKLIYIFLKLPVNHSTFDSTLTGPSCLQQPVPRELDFAFPIACSRAFQAYIPVNHPD